MNIMAVQLSRHPLHCVLRVLQNFQVKKFLNHTTTADSIDIFTKDFLQRTSLRLRRPTEPSSLSIRYFMDTEKTQNDIKNVTMEELEEIILNHMTKNRDSKVIDVLKQITQYRKRISEVALKKLFRNYSIAGKTELIELLQKYSFKIYPTMYKQNGDFIHYLAKAQCMRGNSEKGLLLLTECYVKNEQLRNFYRLIFRELIQDTVLHRSEASLVIFKKSVLEFSEKFNEHYPLICLWHLCWTSSWFSDQMLSNELLDASIKLQEIIRDRATAFSITVLRQEYNEDAVLRLLQSLLKYQMMDEYSRVLQVLFGYKLRTRDLRGCREIIKNCETLGISLPSFQQEKYIKMLIGGSHKLESKSTKPSRDFKLKF